MFLLKRRSDGKYFRNKGYHQDSSWRGVNKGPDDPRWVTDPSACIPFASVTGIRNCRGVVIGAPHSNLRPTDANDRAGYTEFFRLNGEWYSKKNTKARRKWELEKFNEKYEVVAISYKEVQPL